jgi:hypothetical protein
VRSLVINLGEVDSLLQYVGLDLYLAHYADLMLSLNRDYLYWHEFESCTWKVIPQTDEMLLLIHQLLGS